MKKLIIFVLFLFVLCFSFVDARSNRRPALKTLEDFFRFENVEQLTSYFGSKNVFTERTYYGDPNTGGKIYLVSQVNFGTPESAMLIWNREGDQLCEVQTSVYFYDFDLRKIKQIPNNWKTRQGIHAGMYLSRLRAKNWFAMTITVQHEYKNLNYGNLLIHWGWIRKDIKVPFSPQKLVYVYTLDLKQINEFLPKSSNVTLKSNNKIIKKWDPVLELVTIYREGLKPE